MTVAQHVVNLLLLETGEPDQDYEHPLWDAIVADLAAKGVPGAHHKEFDKYQGVYLRVPGVDTFWLDGSLDDMGDLIDAVFIPQHDGEKRIGVGIERNGSNCVADATDLATYCERVVRERALNASINGFMDRELDDPAD